MSLVNFQFVPTSGSLSGKSFEQQTEAGFNELGVKISETSQDAQHAVDTANNALAIADNALATADAALGGAQRADAKAEAALTEAQQAGAKAGDAQERANAAYDLAAQADSKADNAGGEASEALAKADEAHGLAVRAGQKADSAQVSADAAMDLANAATGVYVATEGEDLDADAFFTGASRLYVEPGEIENFPIPAPLYFDVSVSDNGVSAQQIVRAASFTGADPVFYVRSGTIADDSPTWGEWKTTGGAAGIEPLLDEVRSVADSALVAAQNALTLDYFIGWHVFMGIHPDALPGMIPLNGYLMENAHDRAPAGYDFLQTARGQKLCTDEATWQAARRAHWATLADGTKVGWDSIGGICKYVIDTNAGTIRMPDLRGMYAEAAGFDLLNVGGVHGDGIRPLKGSVWYVQFNYTSLNTGIFTLGDAGQAAAFEIGPSGNGAFVLGIDSTRAAPAANKFQPRAWGALPCVYLGLPAS